MEAPNGILNWEISNLVMIIIILPLEFTSGLLFSNLKGGNQFNISSVELGVVLLGMLVYLSVRIYCQYIVSFYPGNMISTATNEKDDQDNFARFEAAGLV